MRQQRGTRAHADPYGFKPELQGFGRRAGVMYRRWRAYGGSRRDEQRRSSDLALGALFPGFAFSMTPFDTFSQRMLCAGTFDH